VGGSEAPKSGRARVIPVNGHLRPLLSKRGKGHEKVFSEGTKEQWLTRLKKITKDLPGFGERKGPGSYGHKLWADLAARLAQNGASA